MEGYNAGEEDCVGVRVGGDVDFDFNILTALKGWVGHAPQGRGALHINCICRCRVPFLKKIFVSRQRGIYIYYNCI
jgi:hypothetical protein